MVQYNTFDQSTGVRLHTTVMIPMCYLERIQELVTSMESGRESNLCVNVCNNHIMYANLLHEILLNISWSN